MNHAFTSGFASVKIISVWERYTSTITSMRMNWNFSCSYWTKLLFRRSVQEILSQSEILRFVCVSQAFSSPFSSVGEKTTATQGCKKILSCARHYLLLFTGFICLCILFPLLDKDKVFFVCSRGGLPTMSQDARLEWIQYSTRQPVKQWIKGVSF